jgi:hypothetical protein
MVLDMPVAIKDIDWSFWFAPSLLHDSGAMLCHPLQITLLLVRNSSCLAIGL